MELVIPITSIVIVCNERRRLADCLKSLFLSDQILVYDMGSTDGSVDIAKQFASEVRQIEQVDIVEKVWGKAVSEAKNDWVILLDPDEVFPSHLFTEIFDVIRNQQDLGLISVPWVYYFLGKRLTSTTWGREHYKARIFNRHKIEISGLLFEGIKLKPGYLRYTFPYDSGNAIQHYWIDSIPQLFAKHWRYIKHDGEARYKKGQRFNFKRKIKDTYKTLRKDLLDYNGLGDGWRGFFLSFFHAWFIWMCYISLCYYQFFKAKR